jgi:hypothetical protein
MVSLDEVLKEANFVAQSESLHLLEIDRTDYAIKLRLLIDQEIFIQIYANESSGKLNLALIMREPRIYGFDREGAYIIFIHLLTPFIVKSPSAASNASEQRARLDGKWQPIREGNLGRWRIAIFISAGKSCGGKSGPPSATGKLSCLNNREKSIWASLGNGSMMLNLSKASPTPAASAA